MLSYIGKLFEKSIHTRLLAHINDNNLFRYEQFGFRQHHSTVHQLKRVADFIHQNKANRKTTSTVLLDIKKAFDTIWYDKLSKMHTPIAMYLIKVIVSFNTDLKFMVEITGVRSNIKAVVAGAPQGSSLSPNLYAVYINDLWMHKQM